ncbi:MAG: hypothetical protein RSE97_06800 [Oscillospiraceae bacterium]
MTKAIVSPDGWVLCPFHFTKLCRIDEDGEARGVKLWCSRCKAEHVLNSSAK